MLTKRVILRKLSGAKLFMLVYRVSPNPIEIYKDFMFNRKEMYNYIV